MEKLDYTIELADNGITVRNNVVRTMEVYQEQENNYRECYKRGLSDSIASYLADILLNGTDKLKTKDKYNIKIAIR